MLPKFGCSRNMVVTSSGAKIWVRFYFDIMSGGKMDNFILMYFGCFIGDAKKKIFYVAA